MVGTKHQSQIFVILVFVPISWRIPIAQLLPSHTVQGCVSEKSKATCVDQLGFELSLPYHEAKTNIT